MHNKLDDKVFCAILNYKKKKIRLMDIASIPRLEDFSIMHNTLSRKFLYSNMLSP